VSPRKQRGERSADRRSGAAAPVGGRVTYARRRQCGRLTSHDAGRSPLGAPPRDLWRPGPRGMKQSGFTVCELHSASKTRVNALIASARSGGGRVPGASRGLLASANARDAASRSAHAMPREEHPRRTGRLTLQASSNNRKENIQLSPV